jgi:hypothetical protein
VPQIASISHRRGKHIKGKRTVVFGKDRGHVPYLVNVAAGKGIDKHRPGIGFIIFDLSFKHAVCPADGLACLVIAPHGDVDPVSDRFGYEL